MHRDKRCYLETLMNEENIMFACLTETWFPNSVKEQVCDNELCINNFNILRCDRANQKLALGGVCMHLLERQLNYKNSNK
jgi:hypothetical protein